MGTMLALIGTLVSLTVLAFLLDNARRSELFERALGDDYMPLDTNADMEPDSDEGFDKRLLNKRDDNE